MLSADPEEYSCMPTDPQAVMMLSPKNRVSVCQSCLGKSGVDGECCCGKQQSSLTECGVGSEQNCKSGCCSSY